MNGITRLPRFGGRITSTQVTVASVLTLLAVFLFDILVAPLGVAAGVAYGPAVLLALWHTDRRFTFVIAGIASALTILGFHLSDPSGPIWVLIANRLFALAEIWLIAVIGNWLVLSRHRKEEKKLRAAEHEADMARAAKTRFLLAASNDIRHHLQTLVLLNAALGRTVDNAKGQEMLLAQGDALGHLSDLMNSLLDITDMETGEVTPKIEDVSVAHILRVLDEQFRGKAAAKNLVLEIEPTDAVVQTDRQLFGKALRSLISNAIRYTEEGKVTVRCVSENGGIRVMVQDTGIGIPDDHLADIFDEFYRVENDSAARDVGLGLGLTIVDRITRMLGMQLNVESSPGKGSLFSLFLPAPEPPVTA
jgi:signal transduction histidine kinase